VREPPRLPAGCHVAVEDAPSRTDRRIIDDELNALNRPFFSGAEFGRMGIFIRDADDKIVAGLDGMVEANWLFVDNLWVAESLRGLGIGSWLLAEGEHRAVARGCHSAWLDTFSFQAPDFYRKLGYTVFATLDYPPAHQRYFLRKSLVDPTTRPAGRPASNAA
jgi:GNAT superfamily N-acetyltransferase